MSNTGYSRTSAFPQRYRANLPERHASSGEWETLEIFEVTPPTSEPWHAGVYATADVDAGTVGQLRLRSSAASDATGSGVWAVSGGKIITPSGSVATMAGFNGGAPVALGQFGSSAGEYVAWASEGFPPFTLSTDATPSGFTVAGGHLNAGRYWNHELNTWADLPDRAYAFTGGLSSTAVAQGIVKPGDHWHSPLYRMNAMLRSGALTWEAGITKTQTIPQYVARVQELVALGFTVAVEPYDLTQTNPTLPAGLVSDPMLAASSLADGAIRDAVEFYDALCAAFPGGSHNVWIGLPNESHTVGPASTNYRDMIVTLARRIRGKGFTGLITLPLAYWSPDLGGLAAGDYDTLSSTLAGHSVGLWAWESHNYGKRWVGGSASLYTWAQMEAYLTACQAAGRVVWMSEYGEATPIGGSTTGDDTADRRGVDIAARDTFGQALGVKYGYTCPTVWALADHTFTRRYSVTYGPTNKGNPSGPDPHASGGSGTVAPWDIDGSAASLEWLTPLGLAHWQLAHSIDATGSELTGISPPVTVSAFTRNLRLGFEGIPAGTQLLYVEGRRTAGAGGVRLIQARPTILSAPPPALVTGSAPAGGGSGGGGGGGTVTATDVRSTFVSEVESTTFTILPSWFSPAVQPGDKVVLIGAAPGPSDVSTFSWTAFPGSALTSASGGTYNPRVMATVVDYNAAGWTVTASSNFRVAGICLSNAVGLAASTPVQAFSPANPASVAHGADAVGLVVNVLNYTTATVTAPTTSPGTHTTVIDKSAVPRQIHVAKIARPTAGTYDPGTATTGPGSEESTAFAIIAQPTASSAFPAAPTVPTFNAGSAITLGLTDNIASIVAANPAGTHYQLVSGTYSSPGFDNVRPKTGNHFKGPASGVAVLEGTGKTWAFRAINATGSSDNVTISGPVGSIKIQNYGAGTTRAEYGAIQAQPTDTSVGSTSFTYGVAQGWFIQGVELSKNGAQGIRMSDYCTVYQVTIYGHTVSGIGADRCVGGLVHSCTLNANGINPATGIYSNGANMKVTFHNSSEGRTQELPVGVQRPKAPLRIVSTNRAATNAGVTGSSNIGLWADLDCQQVEVYGGTYTDNAWCGIVLEGCNNAYLTGFTITNSDGYGAANGEDFILGGLTIAESTNVTVESYTITNSVRALIVRQSNRSADWYNSNNASFVNYSWAAGPRYWIDATGPLPIPAASDRANMWTGNLTFRSGTFTSCDRVMLSEGTNGGGMATAGSIPLNSIRFEANNYAGSGSILFYDRSTTGINLAAW